MSHQESDQSVRKTVEKTDAEWRARVVTKEFTPDTDRMVLDLRGAYDIAGLKKLEREFIFDRRGAGSVTVIDRVEFAAPAAFETALVTLGQAAIEGTRVRLTDGPATLVAEVSCEGAAFEISTVWVRPASIAMSSLVITPPISGSFSL